jgi:hypothetical protein
LTEKRGKEKGGVKHIEEGKDIQVPEKYRRILIIILIPLFLICFFLFGLGLGTVVIITAYVILMEATVQGRAKQIRRKRTVRRVKKCTLDRFADKCLACTSYVIKEGRGYCMKNRIWLE